VKQTDRVSIGKSKLFSYVFITNSIKEDRKKYNLRVCAEAEYSIPKSNFDQPTHNCFLFFIFYISAMCVYIHICMNAFLPHLSPWSINSTAICDYIYDFRSESSHAWKPGDRRYIPYLDFLRIRRRTFFSCFSILPKLYKRIFTWQ